MQNPKVNYVLRLIKLLDETMKVGIKFRIVYFWGGRKGDAFVKGKKGSVTVFVTFYFFTCEVNTLVIYYIIFILLCIYKIFQNKKFKEK